MDNESGDHGHHRAQNSSSTSLNNDSRSTLLGEFDAINVIVRYVRQRDEEEGDMYANVLCLRLPLRLVLLEESVRRWCRVLWGRPRSARAIPRRSFPPPDKYSSPVCFSPSLFLSLFFFLFRPAERSSARLHFQCGLRTGSESRGSLRTFRSQATHQSG